MIKESFTVHSFSPMWMYARSTDRALTYCEDMMKKSQHDLLLKVEQSLRQRFHDAGSADGISIDKSELEDLADQIKEALDKV